MSEKVDGFCAIASDVDPVAVFGESSVDVVSDGRFVIHDEDQIATIRRCVEKDGRGITIRNLAGSGQPNLKCAAGVNDGVQYYESPMLFHDAPYG